MRILYVSSSTVPSRAANSVHVMKMCQALSELGHEARLLTLDRSNSLAGEVADVFEHYGVSRSFEMKRLPFLPRVPGRQLIYAVAARREAGRWNPDLVYGRYFPAMALAGLSGLPVVWESHERIWERSAVARALARRLFKARGFRRLVVISEALKTMYVDSGLIEADRIFVAHDAADPVSSPPPSVRLGQPFRAGYVGGVYPGRGIELLLECADRLPVVEFHFVGGTGEDLQKLPGVDKLGANVICHGYQPPERIPELRASFDVLLAPYQRKVAVWGGNGDTSAFMSPLKIFEYMASGRPMICSDLPVLREVLNEENALLVSPDDTTAWAEAIARIRDDQMFAEKLATAALSDFQANYTWKTRAERILAACAQD